MPKIGNRVKETTDTTGTGSLDLNGAPTGFRAFLEEFNSGDTAYYLIVDDPDNPTAYEYGVGTVTAGTPDTLSRDTVEGSSNSGNKVSFLAGTKTVIATPTAAALGGAGPLAGWALKNPAVAAKVAAYSVLAADDGKLVSGNASGLSPASLTLTLPALAAADAGYIVAAINVGATGTVVLVSGDSPADTINGAASLTLTGQYDAAWLWWTGTAWLAIETLALIDDDSFATASATTAASSESVKAYVDSVAGATRHVASTTPTAANAVDFETGFGNDDDYMEFVLDNISPATDGVDLWLRVKDGGSYQADAGDYRYVVELNDNAGAGGTDVNGSQSATEINLTDGLAAGSDIGEVVSGFVRVIAPTAGNKVRIVWDLFYQFTDGRDVHATGMGEFVTAAAIEGVRFLWESAANFDAAGEIHQRRATS